MASKVIKSGMDSDTFKFKYHVRTYKATSNAVAYPTMGMTIIHNLLIENSIHMVMQNVE